MPLDITRNIDRFEGEDTFQFTLTMTVSRPSTVAFVVYNTDGSTLAPETVQVSSNCAVESGTTTGLFYMNRVLPTSVGFYTYMWRAWDSSSRPYTNRGEFEVIRTEPHSFYTYGTRVEVMKRARQLIGRGDITERDIRPHMEAGDGWIDSKIGVRVSVPLSPVPGWAREMSNRMAIYFLHQSYYSGQKTDEPPAVVRQFDKDNEFLDGVVEGKYSLVGETEVVAITGGIEGGVPAFGRSDVEKQEIDTDITDFEDSQRD